MRNGLTLLRKEGSKEERKEERVSATDAAAPASKTSEACFLSIAHLENSSRITRDSRVWD